MKIKLTVDQQHDIAVKVLQNWYEDGLFDQDIGKVLSALLTVIEYGMVPEEFEKWYTSLD